ncbi:MAG: hypothetical protein AB1631_02685 [Acidobacteriota bacterium]
MASMQKICPKCGIQIDIGLAQCLECGAQVGTVFSEANIPKEDARAKARQNNSAQLQYFQKIDRSQERANNAVIMGIASFFCSLIAFFIGFVLFKDISVFVFASFFCSGVGFLMSLTSIFWGADSSRTLKAAQIEEGQGMATAGVVIGIIGIVAQICQILYTIKMGLV